MLSCKSDWAHPHHPVFISELSTVFWSICLDFVCLFGQLVGWPTFETRSYVVQADLRLALKLIQPSTPVSSSAPKSWGARCNPQDPDYVITFIFGFFPLSLLALEFPQKFLLLRIVPNSTYLDSWSPRSSQDDHITNNHTGSSTTPSKTASEFQTIEFPPHSHHKFTFLSSSLLPTLSSISSVYGQQNIPGTVPSPSTQPSGILQELLGVEIPWLEGFG